MGNIVVQECKYTSTYLIQLRHFYIFLLVANVMTIMFRNCRQPNGQTYYYNSSVKLKRPHFLTGDRLPEQYLDPLFEMNKYIHMLVFLGNATERHPKVTKKIFIQKEGRKEQNK